MNRLSKETSPYLLQHQHNPVDWYPWGPEAFEAARSQDKPIFVSVGYSTCYWCHVMERQCFENPQVAAEMNAKFINIKVDREERPDVDALYMTAVQVLTQQGGWPMSVWLTPDLKPYYGGTYFPPEDGHGRPGFRRVLDALDDAYRNRKLEVQNTANEITGVLRQVSRLVPPKANVTIGQAWIDRMVTRDVADYDAKYGGFGRAPKFPRQTELEFLLHWLGNSPTDLKNANRIKQMITHTLDAMALGGIRDHLGGGFHRYSTDAKWLVPHFEIMLYDQAMLGYVYAEAYRQFDDKRYAAVAKGIFDFVLREMTSPAGAFYTAFDAEVDSQEGLNYLWKLDEVVQILGHDDAELFARAYGLEQGPNFADPHHSDGGPDKNIVYIADVNLVDRDEALLAPMRQKLKAVRDQRKQPLLDTKILTSWNALMIRALAHGGAVLKEARYTAAAKKAADFLLTEHRTPDGGLYRSSRDGVKKYAGMLDDYAFLAQALQTLDGEPGSDVVSIMQSRFADPADGAFYFTESTANDLIVRQKIGSDSPLPSGNGVAVQVLLALGQIDAAKKVLVAFAQQLDAHGAGMSALVQAAATYIQQVGPIEVPAGAALPDQPQTPEDIASSVVSLGARWDGPQTLRLTFDIADGYHLNANPAGEGLVATALAIDGAEIQPIEYPPGETKKFPFADTEIAVYEKRLVLLLQFVQEPKGRLTVTMTYQACTDSACLPPVRKAAMFET